MKELDIQDEMKGQIVTEGFDEFYYANNSDCTWTLNASDDLKLTYEIAYIDIEPGPPFCPFDYLTVEKEDENGEPLCDEYELTAR